MQTDSIPNEVRVFLAQSAETAARLSQLLPAGAPSAWSRIAYRHLLTAILRDWSENGTSELEDEDIQNLTSFVHLAAQTASQPLPDQEATFEVVLKSLLEDWVDNWFTDAGEEEEGEEDLDE
jgi:hypothetical protein